jgi:peptide-N4-(N-acetyl-beta-glucosaminyl)asparagine amidase
MRDAAKYSQKRDRAPEAVLLHIMTELRNMRRSNMSKQEKFRLEGEDMREDRELRGYVISSIAQKVSKINADDILHGRPSRSEPEADAPKALEGRTSGNAQWIRARGESGQSTPNPQDPRNQHPR